MLKLCAILSLHLLELPPFPLYALPIFSLASKSLTMLLFFHITRKK